MELQLYRRSRLPWQSVEARRSPVHAESTERGHAPGSNQRSAEPKVLPPAWCEDIAPDNTGGLVYFGPEEEARMAHFDEDQPKKPVAWTIGEDLSSLSIDELGARIEMLKAEIDRIAEAIAAKRASLGVADSFFKR